MIKNQNTTSTLKRSRSEQGICKAVFPEGPAELKVKMSSEEHGRVIVHFDVDAFYAQFEEVAHPELKTKPLGVYQKTIIVTSNYVARAYGIKKCMLTTEAIKLCPNLVLVNGENLEKYRQVSQDITKFIQEKYKVPVEKLGFDENFVDISKLVEQKSSVRKINSEIHEGNLSDEEDFSSNLSVQKHLSNKITLNDKQVLGKRKSEELEPDSLGSSNKKPKTKPFENEIYLFPSSKNERDLPKHSTSAYQVENCDSDVDNFASVTGHVYNNTTGRCPCGCIERICQGTRIANDIRQDIYKAFGLTLSAGISYNKLLAKLVGSLHKPNQQTVIFPNSVLHLMSTVHLRQIPGIGSKMFDKLANSLNIKTVEDLQNTSKVNLGRVFDSVTADWLSSVSYGRDSSKVKIFSKQSSLGVEDRYYKPITQLTAFKSETQVLLDRLLKLIRRDGRTPRLMKINLRFDHFKYEFKLDSKQCQINPSVFSTHDQSTIEKYLLDVVVKLYKELCTKKNSNTITYINIAVGNFIEVADSHNSILKFCQKTSNAISSEIKPETRSTCYLQIDSVGASQSSIADCVSLKESVNSESPQNSNSLHDLDSNTSSSCNSGNTSNECKSNTKEQVTSKSNVDVSSVSTNQLELNSSYKNTLNIDNIDREVLNELPDDIRKEIELELNKKNSILSGPSSSGNSNRTSNTPVNSKRKTTIKQLSMLNFVQKK